MHIRIRQLLRLMLVLVIFGCGADSDLLRDQGSSDKPTGEAYNILTKGTYKYKKINGQYLGFDYYILSTDCKIDNCTLLHNEYIIFDGNVTEQSDAKYIQLGPKGWYEKSNINECLITFSGSNFIEKCPDGQVNTIDINTSTLENSKLVDYDSNLISSDDLKDNTSQFANNAPSGHPCRFKSDSKKEDIFIRAILA